MKKIRQIFNLMSIRERLLLATIVWVAIFVWATSIAKDSKISVNRFKTTGFQMEEQDVWFSSKAGIDARLTAALRRLDTTKTYSGSELVGKIDTIARGPGINFDIGSPRTEDLETVKIHTIRINFRKVEIGDLISFDQKIRDESPYMGLTGVKVDANKADPRLLNARFTISSFELKDSSI